jgi:amino acid transporter
MRLIVYLLCIAALPIIRRGADEEARTRAFRLWGGYSIPAVAFVLCLWIAAQSSLGSLQLTAALFAGGLVLYAIATLSDRRSKGH